MKLYILILLILALSSSAFSQKADYELGKPSELKGCTKLFIDTDLNNRERIVKKLNKLKLKNLKIVGNRSAAEMFLIFSGNSMPLDIGNARLTELNKANTIPPVIDISVGEGAILIYGREKGKVRLLFRLNYKQESQFEDTPADKFAAEFAKYYKKANGLK